MAKITADSGILKFKKEIYADAVDYFRTHPDSFAEDVMGISLNIYQKVLMRAFFTYSCNIWVLSRGLGKTWLGMLCLVVYCLLNPRTKAGIMSPAFRQGKLAVQEKYKNELCEMSPFLQQEEQNFICNNAKARIEWFNGSWIEAYPIGSAGEKIRGARLHVVLVDEAAYIPKVIIEKVVKPMMIVNRGYRVGKDMKKSKKNKILLSSSANYRFNHLYELFIEYLHKMAEPDNTRFFAMSLPYMIGIQCGLFDEAWVDDQRNTMTDVEFEMEYMGTFPKLAENAWVQYDKIQDCSDLVKIETQGDPEYNYVMSVDVARIEGRDNTVIDIFKKHWYDTHCELDLVYTRSMNGKTFSEQAENVRELLRRFPTVMRIFQDTMTIGQGLSDELAKDFYCVEDEKWYPPLIDMNDPTAMGNLTRTKGVPIIFGIKATPEINHKMGYAIKNFVEKRWVHLYPYGVEEKRDLTAEENLIVMETEATRFELVSIEQIGMAGQWLKFSTKSKRKDRWSAMGMALYGVTLMVEERNKKPEEVEVMVSISQR